MYLYRLAARITTVHRLRLLRFVAETTKHVYCTFEMRTTKLPYIRGSVHVFWKPTYDAHNRTAPPLDKKKQASGHGQTHADKMGKRHRGRSPSSSSSEEEDRGRGKPSKSSKQRKVCVVVGRAARQKWCTHSADAPCSSN